MLGRKMLRDIKQNLSQFITIFLMITIGIMAYSGIETYMSGMKTAADNFYTDYNLQDLNVLGVNFSEEDLETIKNIDGVNNAERKMVVNAVNGDDKDKNFIVSFIESNDISKFYLFSGEEFNADKKGVWVDNFYAEKNNLKVGDKLKFKFNNMEFEEEILRINKCSRSCV